MKRREFIRNLSIFGVSISSIFSAQPLPAKPKLIDPIDDDDHTLPFNDAQIGSHDWKMDESKNWIPSDMDFYIRRYTKLDDIVNRDVEDGNFWKSVNFHKKGGGKFSLTRQRSDCKTFVVKRKFKGTPSIQGDGNNAYIVDDEFDYLCNQLDRFLEQE